MHESAAPTIDRFDTGLTEATPEPVRSRARRPAMPKAAEAVDATFFRDLIWNMQNGVIAIDRDRRLVAMNAVAYRILHLEFDARDVGRRIASVLSAHQELADILSGAFDVAELPNRAELRLGPVDQVLGYTLSLVRNPGGSVIGAALMFKDLTAVEQLEERERLRDRLAALGEMAAAIAHEVKNPLAGIEVAAGVLRRQLVERPDAQAALSEIIREAESANLIVVKVLEFVRPVRLQPEPVPIGLLLEDAVSSAGHQSARGSTVVRFDIDAGVPDLPGDAQLLHQLFTNLIMNAFEALDGQGHVTIRAARVVDDGRQGARIRTSRLRDLVAIDIADDGPGIEPDILERIFSPFFTTKAKGSGLGLALVRKIVDAHGGRVEVTAPAEGGTRFRVLLTQNPDPTVHSVLEA